MKLQTQYSRATIISSLFVLLMAGIGYYFLLHYVLEEQLDETLRVEEAEIQDYILKNKQLPPATTFKDQRTWFEKAHQPVKRHFSSLRTDMPGEKNDELIRELTFPVEVDGNYYAANVSKSQEETEELIGLTLLVSLGILFLLGVVLFFFNQVILKRLWSPFYNTLSSIKNFDLNAPAPVKMKKTSVDEFNELNESVNLMTEKVIRDYISLKDFTDHASHEMQTPLAVINSRLDILIQDQGLSAESLQQVQGIYNSIGKISRIGNSLLLLSRIDNNQFSAREMVNMRKVIEAKLSELEELIHTASIRVVADLNDVIVSMNDQLADTLISNLVVNAIKYSKANDTINIACRKYTLTISNPGAAALDSTHVFDRFWKSDYSDGTGLGLAIAKQIAEKYGFEISYEFSGGMHVFKLFFSEVYYE